jgi:ArsR family transcriptional regulator
MRSPSLAPVALAIHYVDMSRHIDAKKAKGAFAALAQPTRLKAFRKLVAAHPQGLPAGEIAAFCRVPHNTMSTHLAALMRARLITVTRDGRVMNYCADLDGLRGLVDFLMHDCCGGRPEICAPVVEHFNAASCAPAKEAIDA